jgi:hypothetical protein
MNIAGVIKDWMLIFFSFYLFHAPVTTLTLVGYAFCCSGVVVYNHMKLQMIKNKVAAGGGGKADEEKPKEERWVVEVGELAPSGRGWGERGMFGAAGHGSAAVCRKPHRSTPGAPRLFPAAGNPKLLL